jgi:hypothetical protein
MSMKWTAMRATMLACYQLHGGFFLLCLFFNPADIIFSEVPSSVNLGPDIIKHKA